MKKEESGTKNEGKRKEEECSYKGERKIRKRLKESKKLRRKRKEEEKRREKYGWTYKI